MNVLPDAVVIRLSGSSLTFANDGNDTLYWLKSILFLFRMFQNRYLTLNTLPMKQGYNHF